MSSIAFTPRVLRDVSAVSAVSAVNLSVEHVGRKLTASPAPVFATRDASFRLGGSIPCPIGARLWV
ncbi:hypothetical protein [Rhizobium sp. TH2]|uniref:hypothetical protein n=1 Tax=Rhizobium sp. TH2 TaxID=2775403 RepID=UPI0035BEA48B